MNLSRGIYPGILTEAGVGPALGSAASTSPVPVDVRDRTGGIRLSSETEAAVYFCCLEAVQNAAKHAVADGVVIEIEHRDDRVTFVVEDDGRGFDPAAVSTGSGLANMRDRIDSVGGRVEVGPASTGGTRVAGWVPARGRLRRRELLMSYRVLGLAAGSDQPRESHRGHAAHGRHGDPDVGRHSPAARVAVGQPRLARQLAPRRVDRAALPQQPRGVVAPRRRDHDVAVAGHGDLCQLGARRGRTTGGREPGRLRRPCQRLAGRASRRGAADPGLPARPGRALALTTMEERRHRLGRRHRHLRLRHLLHRPADHRRRRRRPRTSPRTPQCSRPSVSSASRHACSPRSSRWSRGGAARPTRSASS